LLVALHGASNHGANTSKSAYIDFGGIIAPALEGIGSRGVKTFDDDDDDDDGLPNIARSDVLVSPS
jgi:hypothetical protein